MINVSRRNALSAAGGVGAALLLPLQVSVAAESSVDFPPASDRKANLHNLLRMQMSVKEEDVPWYYTGRIYAQVGDAEPKLLLALEGTEIYWPRRQEDGSIAISSRTLTFFRDPESGEMVDGLDNPYTKTKNLVQPNQLGGVDSSIYSPEGMIVGREFQPEDAKPEPWKIEWHSARDVVWLTSSRGLTFLPQPWLETMTIFCSASEFADPGVANTASNFSSTYLSPWMRWMDMGDRPGHLVWHSSGRKLESIEQLPDEYRERADKERPGELTANPKSWDT